MKLDHRKMAMHAAILRAYNLADHGNHRAVYEALTPAVRESEALLTPAEFEHLMRGTKIEA